MLESDLVDKIIIVLLSCIVGWAIISDVRCLKIQNRFCISIALLYPAHVLTAPYSVDWLGALAVASIVFVVGVILFACRFVGGGDVKLIAALSLWAGPAAVLPFLLLTTLAGGALALFMLTPVRFAFASILESAGARRLGDLLLGPSIPYAVPIAAGAVAAIGPMLVGSLS